uniref:Uncharacterized protein n=1 Tax=Oryza rufipogon TaxID=4529 RepID=A0A0E0MYF6_ORYRU
MCFNDVFQTHPRQKGPEVNLFLLNPISSPSRASTAHLPIGVESRASDRDERLRLEQRGGGEDFRLRSSRRRRRRLSRRAAPPSTAIFQSAPRRDGRRRQARPRVAAGGAVGEEGGLHAPHLPVPPRRQHLHRSLRICKDLQERPGKEERSDCCCCSCSCSIVIPSCPSC